MDKERGTVSRLSREASSGKGFIRRDGENDIGSMVRGGGQTLGKP